jgi:cytochrome c-type biogenesis protein
MNIFISRGYRASTRINSLFIIALVFCALFLNPFISFGQNNSPTTAENQWEADMAWIPPGSFQFGTNQVDEEGEALSIGIPKPWYADETPERAVFLKGFYIDRYEVTNRRYKIYIDNTGAPTPDYWENGQIPQDKEDYPVAWVNWFDAVNFCQWAGKKLPTEKEWERTAKGTKGSDYPWGKEFKAENANLTMKAGGKNGVLKVGSFPNGANAEGVEDLIGNVWEWTAADYAPYPGSTYQSPQFETGSKTLRGASVAYIGHFPGNLYLAALKKMARNGFRQPASPDDGAEDVGFRCASKTKPALFGALSKVAQPQTLKQPADLFGSSSNGSTSSSSKSSGVSLGQNPFEAQPTLPQSGTLILIVLSFIAGLMSFLSPCTLPILPAYFAVTAQAERTRVSFMAIAFFCGLASVFVLMGASASFFGQFLRDYIFSLTTVGGIFVAVFGVMTIFGQGFSGANFQTQPTRTFVGSFLFGAAFALGWTPCVGPVLSGILILAASDKTIFQGMSLLFFYAAGLGLPLILIAAFFGNLRKDSLFWKILRGRGWDVNIAGKTIILHSTNVFSGLLLAALGTALAMGYLTYLNSLIPIELQVWFSELEESLLKAFM